MRRRFHDRLTARLFGEGKHADFRTLLDEKLSPYLSSHAYQFWRRNERAFESSFYVRRSSHCRH